MQITSRMAKYTVITQHTVSVHPHITNNGLLDVHSFTGVWRIYQKKIKNKQDVYN